MPVELLYYGAQVHTVTTVETFKLRNESFLAYRKFSESKFNEPFPELALHHHIGKGGEVEVWNNRCGKEHHGKRYRHRVINARTTDHEIDEHPIAPQVERKDIQPGYCKPILPYSIQDSHTHQHKKRDHRHRKDSYSLEGETVGWMSATHTLKKKQCDKYRGCKPGDRQ